MNSTQSPESSRILAKVESACRRIAPLWPLENFVAVNPYMGLSDMPFWKAHHTLNRLTGTGLCMPRAYYYGQMIQGRITRQDLIAALNELESSWDISQFEQVLFQNPAPSEVSVNLLVTDILNEKSQDLKWSHFVTERISRYCAAYFDQGQALWPLPWKETSLYQGWREFMRIDKTPRVMGLRRLDRMVLTFPETAQDVMAFALKELQVPTEVVDDYLHAALLSVSGWAGWTRYRDWQAQLQGSRDNSTQDLLAIRLAWDVALYRVFGAEIPKDRWMPSGALTAKSFTPSNIGHEVDAVLQTASEIHYQKQLVANITDTKNLVPHNSRPDVQAVFCIDVRSEVYRRALESVSPQIQTHGFAGFFGILMEYFPLGSPQGHRHHPILFNPAYRIQEGIKSPTPRTVDKVIRRRRIHVSTMKAWKLFKTSASSCFAFVEATGFLSAPKLLLDSMGWARPVPSPNVAGLRADVLAHLGPVLADEEPSSSARVVKHTGIPEKERPAAAEFVLRNMGLTRNFSRLIVFVGHGSTTVNNAQATALDCGACGGQTGEASARLAAALLNDPSTRRGLAHKGIVIPDDTHFMAALHDTTTDEVRLFDQNRIPSSHKEDVDRFRQWTQSASQIARMERAPSLDVAQLSAQAVHRSIKHRIRNWAQVRPEWALAGNAAFVAAPRTRTVHANFSGRVFLHDYDWHQDEDFSTLELIMTAPLIVAQWINMQYYGSVVNNRHFGSGNKVLHNVVGGTIGVLEGNGGDLRVGLAMQSLHNGQGWMHEPLRLNVVIEAPSHAIDNVITRHHQVQELVDNHWIHLFQLDENNRIHRRDSNKKWPLYHTS